ncbi:hypothetical protein D6821_02340, partial [Candidatus Parcubacteria bacterium]
IISVVLDEIKESGKAAPKKPKTDKPIKLNERPTEPEKKKEKGVVEKESKTKAPEGAIKEIHDPRGEGRGKHTKIEGKSHRSLTGNLFRRKSG